MASCQRNKLLAPTQENWIVGDQQCIGPLLDDNLEGSVYFPFAASFSAKKSAARPKPRRSVRLQRQIRHSDCSDLRAWQSVMPLAAIPVTSELFYSTSEVKRLAPVTLPPGRLRLFTSRLSLGSRCQ